MVVVSAEQKTTEKKSPETVKMERRVSPRLQASAKQRAEKKELVRKRVELLNESEESLSKKRAGVHRNRRVNVQNTDENKNVPADKEVHDVTKVIATESETVNNTAAVVAVTGGDGGGAVVEKSVYARVKETLRLFNKHYLHFVQEEETRCGKEAVDKEKASKKSKSKKVKSDGEHSKNKSKRPDLKAMSKMKEAKEVLYPKKRIGNLPGVDVGHQFYSRCEMVAVGFHGHWLNGIDSMSVLYSKEYKDYTLPVAVAIVLSGMYEDDLDNAEDVVYTGQGGHDLNGKKHQIRDQTMTRGNLALKNCVEQNVPVRVIRGHESASSYSGKVYTYDGLYKVVQYWAEKGISGFTVYKYRLRRLADQPMLTTNQVQFVNGRVPQSLSDIRGLVCKDISGGQERIPIPATNLVDDPRVPPTGLTYCKDLQVSKNIKLPTSAAGCKCKGACRDPRTCACAKLNDYEFPYVHRDGGRLIEAKAIVFECGPNCGCGPDCVNRTSQGGPKFRFEVFRTPKKGWAVRSWDFIPSGAPICEYIGVLKKTEELDSATENCFIFDIDCLQTMRGLGGRERRLRDVSVPTVNTGRADDQKSESGPEFCIDACTTGNFARFINHSCEPNLFVQCVLSTHQDLKLARVMLFAADNIPPLQELTYDYGYALDSVSGPDGKIIQMACYCGAAGCRKRLF
ncbi:histone-lysine N-methyltransferase, H3 lysine-9 specific SUVH4-like [Mercurialis annua]|uniref:histone-lysine N-methyltransferase, H3 lysine-9 specific SUVH4-like n=1 Tax=Mercurialis annua TaxID=3986 RepID=UPI0021610079|nr:histone-lysine N-methyltransferase, H3 lysine-9 specific SUVH4-like [Mercurialis annua]